MESSEQGGDSNNRDGHQNKAATKGKISLDFHSGQGYDFAGLRIVRCELAVRGKAP